MPMAPDYVSTISYIFDCSARCLFYDSSHTTNFGVPSVHNSPKDQLTFFCNLPYRRTATMMRNSERTLKLYLWKHLVVVARST